MCVVTVPFYTEECTMEFHIIDMSYCITFHMTKHSGQCGTLGFKKCLQAFRKKNCQVNNFKNQHAKFIIGY